MAENPFNLSINNPYNPSFGGAPSTPGNYPDLLRPIVPPFTTVSSLVTALNNQPLPPSAILDPFGPHIIFLKDGSASQGGVDFGTNQGNGFFRIGTNHTAIASGGTTLMEFTPGDVKIDGTLHIPNLISTGVVFAGTNGVLLTDATNFHFNNSTHVLSLSGLINKGVIYAGVGGALTTDEPVFNWDDTGKFLTITNSIGKQLRLAYDNTFHVDIRSDITGTLYLLPTANNVIIQSVNTFAELYIDNNSSAGGHGYSELYFSHGDGFIEWTISREAGNQDLIFISNDAGEVIRFLQLNGYCGLGAIVPRRQIDIGDFSNPQLRLTQNQDVDYVDFQADANGNLVIIPSGSGTVRLPNQEITVGSGTGLTVNDPGSIRHVTYKVTVTFAGLVAGALTADKTIATLPARTKLIGVYADTTTKYVGGAVATATLQVGKTVGGQEYILSHDVFTNPVTKGLSDGDLGTSINRANAVQEGDLPSWTTTTIISVRLTTTGANTSALTQGSTTYYLDTLIYS